MLPELPELPELAPFVIDEIVVVDELNPEVTPPGLTIWTFAVHGAIPALIKKACVDKIFIALLPIRPENVGKAIVM